MGGDRKELPSIDFEKLLMETSATLWSCEEPGLLRTPGWGGGGIHHVSKSGG